ncbi:MAG: GrpB family protein [Anaerolineae bacterium]
MIVIINGPCGVGKTAVAWELNARFERSVMLDGDYIGAVHPFEIYDAPRVTYLYRTLRHLIDFHVHEGGYPNFVINYVFEKPESLLQLRQTLATFGMSMPAYRLIADDAEIEARIRRREHDPTDRRWHLDRYRELVEIQARNARRGDLGTPIDTTGLTTNEVADVIWRHLHGGVVISPYDPAWPARYEAERARVAAALGELALEIHHVGSTAVPGLAAKPVIDLLVAVPDLRPGDFYAPYLQPLGYVFHDHPENTDRRYFSRGTPHTHHLHIVEAGSPALDVHLRFRDALRTRPDLLERYAQTKQTLAARYPDNRAAYTEAKTACVREILAAWDGGSA